MHTLRSIQKSLDLIEQRLTSPLTIHDLASHASMSLWHFQRTFSALVGEPVGRYVKRRRIANAAKRLIDFDGTLLDLALEHQFESHEAFTRAFKAELSITPSDWKNGKGKIRFPRRREILNQEKINERYQNMVYLPEFITLAPATFIGLESRFISATSDDANNLMIIPNLWEDFYRRIEEINSSQPGTFYGLCQNLEAHNLKRVHPDEVFYLASVEVNEGTAVPEGMTAWKSPGGLFAKFEHQGRIETIGETKAYIYGKWFPESEYDEAEGPDLERYDHRFDPHSEDSVLEFLIPVQKRSQS